VKLVSTGATGATGAIGSTGCKNRPRTGATARQVRLVIGATGRRGATGSTGATGRQVRLARRCHRLDGVRLARRVPPADRLPQARRLATGANGSREPTAAETGATGATGVTGARRARSDGCDRCQRSDRSDSATGARARPEDWRARVRLEQRVGLGGGEQRVRRTASNGGETGATESDRELRVDWKNTGATGATGEQNRGDRRVGPELWFATGATGATRPATGATGRQVARCCKRRPARQVCYDSSRRHEDVDPDSNKTCLEIWTPPTQRSLLEGGKLKQWSHSQYGLRGHLLPQSNTSTEETRRR